MFEECFGDRPFIFRLNENGTGPQLLIQVCLERGWKEFNPNNSDQWNLWWRTTVLPVNYYKNIYAWQYVNHIPKGSAICRKDNLVRYLRCMRKTYGYIYDFIPHGYNLPLEYTKLAAECSRGSRPVSSKENNIYESIAKDKPIWICKPVAQSQGKGIYLFKKLSELSYDTNSIVQRYIEKPLLIGGYKFDLRLYVCIPSYYPITIYMYKEGLVRFGTDKFNLNDLRNPFRHLTNSSINKFGPGYCEMKDRIGSGCKWTLKQLRRYFQNVRISDWLLWQKISSLVVLTVLSHISQIPPTVNCFEFFGFDVLIDSTLRPWLLEVNVSPALSSDCDADIFVKKPMLHDMFDLLGFPLYNTGLAVYEASQDTNNDKFEENNEKNTNLMLSNPFSVLNAAGKWKRKQRKMSAKLESTKTNLSSRIKVRSVSASNLKISNPNLPKLQQNTATYRSSVQLDRENVCPNKNLIGDPKKIFTRKKWGNGRDWNNACDKEGGWIRIWPIKSENVQSSDHINVKQMVTEIIKYTKTAKEIVKQYPSASDHQLNKLFEDELEIDRELWLPPI